MDFIIDFYETFGLKATLKFATRPEQRIGSRRDVGPRRGRPARCARGDGPATTS
jgi:threonyl-tRNA synthetase